MGIVANGSLAVEVGAGWRLRAEGDLFGRAAGARELCATICVNFQGWNGWHSRWRELDRQHGAGAGIAVRSAGAEHDHGRRQQDGHEVSQENG